MSEKPVALIIGMGPGLSLALARRFAIGGYRVVGFGRDPAKSEDAISSMTSEGLSVELMAVDAADAIQLRAAIGAIEAQRGAIDVLIYNAYRSTMALPSMVDPAQVIEDFKVNVAAPLTAAQAVLPAMLGRGHGTIVFTGGGLALDPTGWLEASSLAIGKAAIRSLAMTLNKELSPQGIHVGTITVAGQIKPQTAFSPEAIADAYWRFVTEAEPARPAEMIFRG